MLYFVRFNFFWNINRFFIKIFLKIFIFYFFDSLNYFFINKFWINFNLVKKFYLLKFYNQGRGNCIFLIFNIFYSFFFYSFFNIIFNFYNLQFKTYKLGYINSYQIFYLFSNFFKNFFIFNKCLNLKKYFYYF